MKKIFYAVFVFLIVFLTGCKENKTVTQKDLEDALSNLVFLDESYLDYNIPKVIRIKKKSAKVSVFHVNQNSENKMTSTGKILDRSSTYGFSVDLFLTLDNLEATRRVKLKIIGDADYQSFLAKTKLPKAQKGELSLLKSFRNKPLNWESSNPNFTNDGKILKIVSKDTKVTFTLNHPGYPVLKQEVLFLKLSEEDILNDIYNNLNEKFSQTFTTRLFLPETFSYGYIGKWIISDESILKKDANGYTINAGDKTETKITLVINNKEKEFTISVMKNKSLILDKKLEGTLNNLMRDENNHLTLLSGKTEGEWISKEYETPVFLKSLVSWISDTNKEATVEVFARGLDQNDIWSDWFSFSEWGLGRKNKSLGYIKPKTTDKFGFDTEFFYPINGCVPKKMQIKVVLRKYSTKSPVLRGIAITFIMPDYVPNLDLEGLPQKKVYEVPKLYQRSVPTIGNYICSPTSSLMLLLSKGHKISEFAPNPNNLTHYDKTYPHGNFANFTQDHSDDKFYGNWLFNTAAMSSFGETSYVHALHSTKELVYHLATVGPVAASVTGKIIGESGIVWSTNGHLLVIKGYEFIDGKLFFIANDPAITPVEEHYSEKNFSDVWLGKKKYIVYVVE